MVSYGEGTFSIESTQIGTYRVANLYAAQALRPRLGIAIDISLRDIDRLEREEQPLGKYWLDGVRGELRLPSGVSIAILHQLGTRLNVRSESHHASSPVSLAADLDFATIEAIEAQREQGPLSLVIEIWPRLQAESGRFLRCFTQAAQLSIPRDDWLSILEQLNFASYEVVEIRLPASAAKDLHLAAQALGSAERLFAEGNYSGAVGKCRFVIEALTDLGLYEDGRFAAAHLDEERSAALGGIASRVKALANPTHHLSGSDTRFMRAEAKLVLRSCAGLVETAAALSSQEPSG